MIAAQIPVMAGLVPAIHVLPDRKKVLFGRKKGVDARHKAGHDVVSLMAVSGGITA
jgi:hypothetical protein